MPQALKNNKELREKIEKLSISATRIGTPEARLRTERAIQLLLAYEMQRVADDANMDLEIFIYRPEENIGPFLQNFDTLNDALTEVSRTPGNINKFTTGFDEVITLIDVIINNELKIKKVTSSTFMIYFFLCL